MRKSSEVIATLDKIVHGVMVKELICENGSANKYSNHYLVTKSWRVYLKIKKKCPIYFRK